MRIFEFNHANISKETSGQIESMMDALYLKKEILVLDFSAVQSMTEDAMQFLVSLGDRLANLDGPGFVVIGSRDILETLKNTEIAKRAKSLIQVRDTQDANPAQAFKNLEERLNLTLQTAAVEAVQGLSNEACSCEEILADAAMHADYKFTAAMDIQLGQTFKIFFSMTEQDLIQFVSTMLRESASGLRDDMLDWPAEIANYTADYLKVLWGSDMEKRKQISIPAMMKAADVRQVRKDLKLVNNFLIGAEKFEIFVEIWV